MLLSLYQGIKGIILGMGINAYEEIHLQQMEQINQIIFVDGSGLETVLWSK